MKLERILQYGRTLLTNAVSEGDLAVDCTVGNGHDTLFLANLVGETGRVVGFDIQNIAIKNTEERLTEHNLKNRAHLYEIGHENLLSILQNNHADKIANLSGAIFNLGYLPGSDKAIVTKPDSTIAAISQLLKVLKPEGIIVLVIYHGHEEGQHERDELLSFLEQLDQTKAHVLMYRFINQKNNPPFIVAIEKR